MFLGGIGYVRRSKERSNQNEKQILLGIALYLIFASIGIIFFYIARFYAEGSFNGQAFVGEFSEDKTPVFQLIGIGQIFAQMGYVLFVFKVEGAVKKTKRILTLANTTFYIITVLTWWMKLLTFHIIARGLLGIILLLSVLCLLKFSVKIQNLSLFMITGLLFGYVGGAMQLPEAIEANLYPLEFPFVLFLIGYLFIVAPAYINIDKILNTNPKYFWSIFIVAVIIGLSFGIDLYILTRNISFLFQIVVTFVLLFVIVYIYLQRKKAFQSQTGGFTSTISNSESIDKIDIVSVFSRPKTLTEEEVSISKEKKICLLCKGKISNFNFLCKCGAFYCEKCAKALITLENACWACGSAIDETKPIKPFQKEMETVGISVEEKEGRKKK